MKTRRAFPVVSRGFSLIELIIAMGISMVLLAALSSIFATSINTREKIDREGQKIETARYALDTLAEDVRLAGYYGNYAPPFTGATPADWTYGAAAGPCSTTIADLALGWDATSDPVKVPFPIFGYEAHPVPPAVAPSLPGGLTGCLDNYKTGTDVFVIRRTSTNVICLPADRPSPATPECVTSDPVGYKKGEIYLQASSCPDGTVDTVPFIANTGTGNDKAAAATSDFTLRQLGCASTVNASIRKLVYRIYFISSCYDCSAADGIPTLKVAFLTVKSAASKKADGVTIRSASCAAAADSTDLCIDVNDIAPNVEDLHIEYGVDLYEVGGTETGTADGSIEAWLVSNNNPRMNTALAGTPVKNPVTASDPTPAEMRIDAATGENRWEDVMAVKLFLITRDPQTTTGHVDTKSFVMGSKTVATTGDAYRRRLMSSTIKLVNMAGRRETP